MYRIIDTHAHLEEMEDLGLAIRRAREAGILAIIAVGSDDESNRKVLEISQSYPSYVYPALGIHPWSLEACQLDETFRFIEDNIDRAVAIGEVGLDYWLKGAKKDRQKEVFKRVLELARSYGKPVIVHSRGAWKDGLEMVSDAQIEQAVFHWYSGPIDVLSDFMNQGYFISATLAAEYSEPHQRAIREMPLANILLETDSPVEYRGKPSEPADVIRTLRAVARLKAVPEPDVAEITANNAAEIFKLAV